MLFLLFQAGNETYALEADGIREVLPLVALRKIPRGPDYAAGLLRWRDTVVPVIDLSVLLGSGPARPLFSTRIILADYRLDDGSIRMIGLLAEQATELISRAPAEFTPAGISVEEAPFLGPVLPLAGGLVQLVDLRRLLPVPVQQALFTVTEDEDR